MGVDASWEGGEIGGLVSFLLGIYFLPLSSAVVLPVLSSISVCSSELVSTGSGDFTMLIDLLSVLSSISDGGDGRFCN